MDITVKSNVVTFILICLHYVYVPRLMFPPLSSVRERRQNQVFFSLSLASGATFKQCQTYSMLGLSLLCLWQCPNCSYLLQHAPFYNIRNVIL